MSMTDSCFIDDTSSKNYMPYVSPLATWFTGDSRKVRFAQTHKTIRAG